jgi:molybdopterin-guanine dinucleotide biosynthesis protein A
VPEVTVQLFGTLAKGNSAGGPHVVRAATVGGAADVLGIVFDRHVTAALNGDQITRDRMTPLAAGDTVFFLSADAGGLLQTEGWVRAITAASFPAAS